MKIINRRYGLALEVTSDVRDRLATPMLIWTGFNAGSIKQRKEPGFTPAAIQTLKVQERRRVGASGENRSNEAVQARKSKEVLKRTTPNCGATLINLRLLIGVEFEMTQSHDPYKSNDLHAIEWSDQRNRVRECFLGEDKTR